MADSKKRLQKWRDIVGVDTINRWIKDGSLLLSPDFQRNYVWSIERASGLIESLLLSIPIPTIFLFDDGDKKIVIDGKQRLTTIYNFVEKQKFENDKGDEMDFKLVLKDENDNGKKAPRLNNDG